MSDARLGRPEPRAAFRARLRAELVREAAVLAAERAARRSWWSSLLAPALRPAFAVATAAVLLFASAGVAAAGSLPGDPAFALKRAAEQIEVTLAPSDEARARVLAAQAARRLDELSRAATRPERAPTATAEYEAAVDRLAKAVEALRDPSTREAQREAVGEVVEAAREKHVQVLEALRDRLPDAAKPGIDRAIEQTEKLRQGPGPNPAGPEQRAPADRSRPPAPAAPRATPRGAAPGTFPTVVPSPKRP